MITLATLEYATPQEVFDQVVSHLREQGRQSRKSLGDECAYRGDNGLMCAAGCLIADDEYVEKMDNMQMTDWENLVEIDMVPPYHEKLIAELQCVHDAGEEMWEEGFKSIAETFNLSYK